MASADAASDEDYQRRILQGVSRTFALTIPQLPGPLATVVGNAYLLCRIADTIEDDPQLPFEAKREFAQRFIRVVAGADSADGFARELSARLSPAASADEHDLIANTARVIRITQACNPAQRASLARCVRIMAEGMVRYQGSESIEGLADQREMDRYCYYVAGVVGEMLTELFCDHCPALAPARARLLPLAVSFGQGLQMTNILKDLWEDRSRGACWLPRASFERHGVRLGELAPDALPAGYLNALGELIGIAHGHLANALRYTLLIPRSETGIRRFCLWALGMAVLTLRRIDARRAFTSGTQVKISRRAVRATVLLCNAAVRCDPCLRAMFALAGRGLPFTPVEPPPVP